MNLEKLTYQFEQLRSHKSFEILVMIIIIFSALVVGAKTYDMPPSLLQLMRWLDLFITLFFVIEISIRFLGEKKKRNFFRSGWNIFDLVIVVVSLIPVEEGDMALIGRLIRIFRVLRMVSLIPELRILLNSLLKALPQLAYVVALMFIIFYIYAAIGSTFFQNINEVLWGDVSIAMLTLFRVMTFEDWTDVMYETMSVYPLSWIYYLSFIFFTTFAFLNMVIGIVVNVLEQENALMSEMDNPQPELSDIKKQLDELIHLVQKQEKK